MQTNKYVFELTTPKNRKFNVLIGAENEGGALKTMSKIHAEIFGSGNDRLAKVNLDYLHFCHGAAVQGAEKYRDWGKAIDESSAEALIKEFSAHNDFVDRMQKRPVKTVLKGAFSAPFSAPRIVYRNVGRDLLEVWQMLAPLWSQGKQTYKQHLTAHSESVRFNGESLPIVKKESRQKFSVSRLLIFSSLSLLFYAAFASPLVPSLLGIPLFLSGNLLTVYALREFVIFVRASKKRVSNGG